MLPSFNLSSLCFMTHYITSLSLKLFLLKPTIAIQHPLHFDCMASCCFRQHCPLPSDDHVNAMLVNISKLFYLLSCCIVLCFNPTLKKLIYFYIDIIVGLGFLELGIRICDIWNNTYTIRFWVFVGIFASKICLRPGVDLSHLGLLSRYFM